MTHHRSNRDVVMLNAADIRRLGFAVGERVDIVTVTADASLSPERRASRFQIVAHDPGQAGTSDIDHVKPWSPMVHSVTDSTPTWFVPTSGRSTPRRVHHTSTNVCPGSWTTKAFATADVVFHQ